MTACKHLSFGLNCVFIIPKSVLNLVGERGPLFFFFNSSLMLKNVIFLT